MGPTLAGGGRRLANGEAILPWHRPQVLRNIVSDYGRKIMAKGQLRSNKEAKKPKKDKLKTAAGATTPAGFAKASQPPGSGPKKK